METTEKEKKNKGRKKKAVIYARTSSKRQSYDSIVNQKDQAILYADFYGLDIVETYEDVAISGRTDKRNDFQRLISDSKNFDAVLVLRYDRWARSVDIATKYEQLLNDNGAVLISITEDEKDKLECYRKAQESSDHKSEVVLDIMNDLADKHKYLGGPMMVGFSKNEIGGFAINQKEAILVREIFRRYADGETADEIAEDLNDRKITTSGIKQWNRKTLQTMLQNEKYIGKYSWGGKHYDNILPQIVSADVFDQVQKKLLENATRSGHGKASREDEYMLSGKLRCGCCGSMMIGNSSNGISYYSCKNKDCRKTSLRKDSFEDMDLDLSCEFLTEENNDLIAKKYVEYRKSISLEDENNKDTTLTEDEVRFILYELYIGNVDAWYLRKFILDTLISEIIYDGDFLTIDFNLNDRFMNSESDSQERYQIAWVNPDNIL
jgi:DNA invertase Pin-like site-specific DNA recombinase